MFHVNERNISIKKKKLLPEFFMTEDAMNP